MNQGQFDQQIQRLVNNFGKTAYSSERAILLWREVSTLSASWLNLTVDKFIGELKHAPLLPEFREEISKERERIWRGDKEKYAKEAKDFFQGSYQPDDVRTICQMIVKRLQGGVPDADYAQFVKHLDHTAKSAPRKHGEIHCRECGGDGIIFKRHANGNEYVYRCFCIHGQKKPKSYPAYQP